ncbi:MAG: polysaccharide deacetylase family protein [Hungatella sp.]|nr:polysaccharide deacetylase family protein [Hungatella sp.]
MSEWGKTGFRKRAALILWGLVGLFLMADAAGKAFFLSRGEDIRARQAAAEAEEPDCSKEKYVALTFDDGPHPVYTPALLKGLKERGVHVTFFLIGQNIDGNEDIIRQMKEEGHLIGNHSQNHMQLTKEQTKEACDQINRTNEKIREITGQTPEYVRPPFGSWSEELECIVPMKVVLWNVDPLDWKTQNRDRIVRHIVTHVEDGSIILLHDVYGTSVEAALEVIDTLTREGYNFVTVDELLIE